MKYFPIFVLAARYTLLCVPIWASFVAVYEYDGGATFWRCRFGAAGLAPSIWRCRFGASFFWRQGVLTPRGSRTFWRHEMVGRFGAVMIIARFGSMR